MSISDLYEQKNFIENRISSLERKITEYEREYESLRQFKHTVEGSQSEFHTLNSHGSQSLSKVSGYTDVNPVAEKYKKGMNHSLNGIGSNVVGLAFTGFLTRINLKLVFYKEQIGVMELEKRALNMDFDSLIVDINEALNGDE